jgi:signal transduction histidine kinase
VSATSTSAADRVLIVAPTGADAHNLSVVLSRAGLIPAVCRDVAAAAQELEHGCGAILLTEEALNHRRYQDLTAALARQPPWSDVPLVMIVTGGNSPLAAAEAVRLVGPRSNLTLVERPLRRETLLSTLEAALRARRRQYEVKDLLRERDVLLASLEERVAERTARLEELNAELEAFSHSVSHDLRAPLRSLETYARMLCDEFEDTLPEAGRHYAHRIAHIAARMDRLTRDVLALSRLTRGDLQMEAHDLDQVFEELLEQYPDLAAARERMEFRSPLGRVIGHGPSLTQCLSNLLQNALKFVPEGRTPEVRIFSRTAEGRVRVVVQDNGIGIDPSHHRRIFGIFERATSSKVPGTGIGLAIAKKAVERMGGTIGVESAAGAGALFWIELPPAPELPAMPFSHPDPAVRSAPGDTPGAGRSETCPPPDSRRQLHERPT